jgi:hypothetical protein
MRKAAADLEFEEAGRLRDEIRRLEADELGIPDHEKKAPAAGQFDGGQAGDAQDPLRQAAGDKDGQEDERRALSQPTAHPPLFPLTKKGLTNATRHPSSGDSAEGVRRGQCI